MATLPLNFLASCLLILGLVSAASPSLAQATPPGLSAQLGLQVALTTGGSHFDLGETSAVLVRGVRYPLPQRNSFAASVALANLSRNDLAFTFPDAGSALTHFRFRVYNVSGALIWESESAPAAAPSPVEATLRRKSTWKRTVQIPLTVAGGWLPSGRYTLEAKLLADTEIGATTVFDVTTHVPRTDTGISGRVDQSEPAPAALQSDSYTAVRAVRPASSTSSSSASNVVIGISYPPPAELTITEIREPNVRYDHPPFTWTGPVQQDGTFRVMTPPGRFQVSAAKLPGVALFNVGPGTVDGRIASATLDLTVSLGQFTEQNFVLNPKPDSLTYASVEHITSVRPFRILVTYFAPHTGPDPFANLLFIEAKGEVYHKGWRAPRLHPRGNGPAADGYLEYDLQASPPAVSTPEATCQIQVTTTVTTPTPAIGVRVYGADGSVSSTQNFSSAP